MALPADRKNEFDRLQNILKNLHECNELIAETPVQAKMHLKKAIYAGELLLKKYENLNL